VKLNRLISTGGHISAKALLIAGFFVLFSNTAHAVTLHEWTSVTPEGEGTFSFSSGSYQVGLSLTYSDAVDVAVNGNSTGNTAAICREGSSLGNPIDLDSAANRSYVDATYGHSCDEYVGQNVYIWAKVGANFSIAYGQYEQDNWIPFSSVGIDEGAGSANFTYLSGFSSTYNTRFLDVDVTASSSNSTITVDYFLDSEEINTLISEFNPTQVKLSLAERSTSTTFESVGIAINNASSGTSTIVTTYFDSSFLENGKTYDLLIQFNNLDNILTESGHPFPDSYVYVTFTVESGSISEQDNEFYDTTSFIDPDNYQYQQCSITQIGNCITNSLAFLFVPSSSSLQGFSNLSDSLSGKFPFAYLYDFNDSINALFTTAETESLEITYAFSTFGDLTLISKDMIEDVPLSATIKLLLGYLLWIMFSVHMYRRILKIFNPSPI